MKKNIVRVTYWNDAHTKCKTHLVDLNNEARIERNHFLDGLLEFGLDVLVVALFCIVVQIAYITYL